MQELPTHIGTALCCRIDEEDYGGHQSLLTEGIAPSISLFLVLCCLLTMLSLSHETSDVIHNSAVCNMVWYALANSMMVLRS